MSENYIENLLSKGEQLVYEYIKEQTKESGSMKESMDSIAESILERYADRISERRVSVAGGGSKGGNKTFSVASVHRAITKLRKEGIVQVNHSNDNSSPNEITFYGLPDEDQQVSKILEMAGQLNMGIQRFETVLTNKDKAIHQLKLEKKQLYKELDGKNEEIRRANELIKSLQEDLNKAIGGNNPFAEGSIIGTTDLGDNTKAYIIRTH